MKKNNIFKITVAGLLVLLSGPAFAQDEALIERPVANAAQALQGIDPSLSVFFDSGSPFAEAYMTLRGVSSAYASTPLILVDGVEVKLENVNPYTIESVSILKDAAAAAIYGSRASGGAILIKTKLGNPVSTEKPDVEVNANLGFSSPLEQQNKLADSYMNNIRLTQNYNVSARGGSNAVKYYFAGRYYGQEGEYAKNVVGKNGYDNFNMQGNVQARINKLVTYNLNAMYSYKYRNQPFWGGQESFYAGLCSDDMMDYIDSFKDQNTYERNKVHNYMFKHAIDFHIIKGLDINVSYAFNNSHTLYRSRSVDIDEVSTDIAPNRFTEGRRNVKKNDVNASISYKYRFNNGMGISAVVGGQYMKDKFKILRNSVDNLIDPTMSSLTAGDNKFHPYETKYSLERFGGYANLGFTMGNSLDVAGTFRYDNASNFDEGNRGAFSYSASASWNAAEENFMRGIRDYVSVLKVRVSHAMIANQSLPIGYPYEATTGLYTDLNSWILRMNGSLCAAPQEAVMSEGLLCEKVQSENVGLDLAFLKNRLSFSADFLYRKTSDMLRSITEYDEEEVYTEYSNRAEMKTVGLELSLGWRDAMEVASSPLTYSVRAMFSDYNNESNILLIGLPRYNYTVKGSFDWYGVDFSFIMNGTGRQEWNQLENLQWDTYFAKDNLNAGFFRVKNVSLGYTFKFKKIIEGIRVGVSGENLCYASPFKMYSKSIDPQLLFSPASLSQYQRQLLFNVKVNF